MLSLSSQYCFFLVLLSLSLQVQSSISIPKSCPDQESSLLLDFKHSFLLDCSVSQSPSAYPKVKSWGGDVNEDCCQWDGVSCNNETGHVIGIDLSSSCLYGTFPSNNTIFSLAHLQDLNLADNDFNYSRIPSQIGQLSKLRILKLSNSALGGQIPLEVSQLLKLSLLDLSGNDGGSSANSHFGLKLHNPSLERLVHNLTRLNQLSLGGVDISSSVTNILTNLTSLTSISLELCKVYGQFPTSIFHLPHLELVSLEGNTDLKGSFGGFQHNSPLIYLDLSFTAFSGEVPPSIGNLAHLEVLKLSVSGFSGSIPVSLGNLTKLTNLQLEGNAFSGEVPSLTNLTQLQFFSLSNLNVRHSKMFSWLSKLKSLMALGLTSMGLVSQFLSPLSNSTSLQWLDLSENQLTGPIPHWLMNLTQLQWLSLWGNQLQGPIPQSISQLENLDMLDLDDNVNLYGNFEVFLKLKHLTHLDLSGVKFKLPSQNTVNGSVPKFNSLSLQSCNLTQFPQFLRSQDELQLLYLSDNKIHGLIPQWFVDATSESLYILDLSQNLLTGFEQPDMVAPWSHLQILHLQENKLQGSLPLPSNSMVVYQVSQNSLAGGIPQQICIASSLNYLDISFNNLGGHIPDCISELGGSLVVLNLQGNNFDGTIPPLYPKSCKLKMINLAQNQLEGKIPRSLANCNMLEVLDIGNNHVNDTFPSWMGCLPNLQILILRHNNFHGRIGRPNASVDFQPLRIIDLSHNFHIGDLPSDYVLNWQAMKNVDELPSAPQRTSVPLEVFTPSLGLLLSVNYNYSITITNKGNDMLYKKILTVFRVIDFSSNNFTGRIPNSIEELRGLQAINLSNNNLEGGIPSSLATIKDLESLDLSKNMLSGTIPQELTQLTYLEVFNVSHNRLVGSIPQGQQFNTFDNSSFDGNLGLCGSPLSKRCGNVDDPPAPPVNGNGKEDDSDLIDWTVRSLGCVSGFAVGCALGKYITDRNHEWFMETFGRKRRPSTRVRRSARPRN